MALAPVTAAYCQAMPNDPGFMNGNQWGLYNSANRNADIKAPEAWSLYKGDQDNVIIYISDSGLLCRDHVWAGVVDIQKHPDLRGGYCQNYRDFGWHGTFIAGIIAGLTNNNQGIAGVNWNTTINQVDGPSAGSLALTRENLFTAVSNGAEIINMSWGSPSVIDLGLIGVCARAYNSDVLMVSATGNEKLGTINHPSSIPGVMAVGASDKEGNYAMNFSNYGSGISVVAPGGNVADTLPNITIYSTGVRHWRDSIWVEPDSNVNAPGYWLCTNYFRPRYKWGGGTSAAAPFVTGVAGLLKGYAKSKGIVLNNDDLRRIIEITADDVPGTEPGYDEYTGHGKVNAHKALSMLNPPWEIKKGESAGGDVELYGSYSGYVPYWPLIQSVIINNGQRWRVHKTIQLPRYYYDFANPSKKPYVCIRGAQSAGWHYSPDLTGKKNDAQLIGLIVPQKNPSYLTAHTIVYLNWNNMQFYPCSPVQVNFA